MRLNFDRYLLIILWKRYHNIEVINNVKYILRYLKFLASLYLIFQSGILSMLVSYNFSNCFIKKSITDNEYIIDIQSSFLIKKRNRPIRQPKSPRHTIEKKFSKWGLYECDRKFEEVKYELSDDDSLLTMTNTIIFWWLSIKILALNRSMSRETNSQKLIKSIWIAPHQTKVPSHFYSRRF